MAELPSVAPPLAPPKQMSRHVFALLALLALGSAVGLWYYFNQTSVETIKLGAGMELKYRDGLTDILCDEAESRELIIDIQWKHQAVEAVHLEVGDHQIDGPLLEQRDPLVAGLGLLDVVLEAQADRRDTFAHRLVVVDDQDRGHIPRYHEPRGPAISSWAAQPGLAVYIVRSIFARCASGWSWR